MPAYMTRDISQDQLAAGLASQYGLDIIPASVVPFKNTQASRVWRAQLARGEKIIIKENSWYGEQADADALQALERAYHMSEELRGRGVPLVKVFPTRSGTLVSSHDTRALAVMEYVSGEPFTGSDEHYRASGDALARLHQAGADYLSSNPGAAQEIVKDIPVEKPYEESAALYNQGLRQQLLAPHECAAPSVCQAVREHIGLLDETVAYLQTVPIAAPERAAGIVHNDLNHGNILFAPGGQVQAILDIDQLGVAPYVWDVGNSLASFIWKSRAQDPGLDIEAKIRLFLRSYHQRFPLPAAEYGLILAATQRWDMLRILRSLRRHHFENNRLPKLLPKIEDRLLPRLRLAPQLFSFLTPEWIEKNI